MADSIASLMSQLGAMNYTPPSSYTGYVSPSTQINRAVPTPSINTHLTPNDVALTTTPSTGNSGILGTLGTVLNDTIGQPVGLITSMLDNAVKTGKQDFNGKSPWYSELGHFLNDASPEQIIGGTLNHAIASGAKQQWNDWGNMLQGKFSWGDIPSFGFLDGMANSEKHGSDIMSDLGVNNRWGNVAGGLGIDIAADPLTYLTGGLSAASKLGKIEELSKMAELAGNLGLKETKFKNVNEFAQAARDAISAGHGQSIMKVINDTKQAYSQLPHLVNDMVARNAANHEAALNRTMENTINDLTTQVNAARNQAINSHINDWGFAVPFTKGKTFVKAGEYGVNNLLHRSEAIIPQERVDGLIKDASAGDGKLSSAINDAVKARYGVNHTGELTKTMFDDLHDFLSPVIKASEKGGLPDVNVITRGAGNGIQHAISGEDFTKLMDKFKSDNVPWKDVKNQLDSILEQTAHDPNLRESMGSHLAQMVSDYWKNAPIKNFNKVANARKSEAMQWASNMLKNTGHSEEFGTVLKDIHPNGNPVQNMNRLERSVGKATDKMTNTPYDKLGDFRTKMEHAFDKKNIFNTRTLVSKDSFVNSMADHIADANTQRIGDTARYSRAMDKITNYLDKFTKAGGDKTTLMNHAIHIIENHAPDALGKDWLKNPPKEAQQLANLIRPVLDKLGNDEKQAGVLDKLRPNYFPHVVNKDPQTMKAMEDFAKRHPELNGMNSKSVFNKERTSFQTLAQKDNYIAKIEKAIQKEPNPEAQAALREQQDRVANMFDTNVVSALQRRIKTGVRAKAMKEMQTKLSKYGMMKTIVKGSGEEAPQGLTEISKEEAKKLGLGAGRHFIHPDVLKGMKRIDEIFTSEGMNKFVRHMTAFSDAWRPLVTYYKPSHYVNNIVGNVINNMAAGIKVSDYKVAQKLIDGYKAGTLTKEQMKIIDEAYKHNVISGGFLYDSHPTYQHENPTKLEKIGKMIGDNKVIKNVRHFAGEKVDDISRLANFVNGINKYGKAGEAAKQVRTYLFNYHELTNADRTMRIAVPFWNWMKRNVPLQMKLLMENPKFAMNNMRVAQLFNQDENGASWQKDSAFHIPKAITDALGSKNEYYTQNPSPIMDLDNMLNPSQELGSMNPAAKMITEMALNRQYFTGNPISYGSKTTQAKDVPAYLAKNFGVMGNLFDLLSGKKSPAESGVNFLHSVTKVNSKNPNGG